MKSALLLGVLFFIVFLMSHENLDEFHGFLYWGQRIGDCMDVATVGQIATSQAVWAIVALLLGVTFFKKLYNDSTSRENRLIEQEQQYREESKEREKQLMQHLTRSNESHERTTAAMEGMNKSLTSLEGRMDRMEKRTYKKTEKDDGQ